MYSHYVIVLDWATEDDGDVQLMGIAHTLDDAKEIFSRCVDGERELAVEKGYNIIEDNEMILDAGIMGYWRDNHITLYIQGVN